MPTPPSEAEEPSLTELVRSIIDQSKVFVRAEIDLLKVEARQNLTRAVAAFAVALIGGVLLSTALSLAAAAIVLAQAGAAATALLTAAGVHVLVTCISVGLVVAWLRKRHGASIVSTSPLPMAARHGTSVS